MHETQNVETYIWWIKWNSDEKQWKCKKWSFNGNNMSYMCNAMSRILYGYIVSNRNYQVEDLDNKLSS